MAESLGSPEKAALIALLLADWELSNKELWERHGVDLRKEAREKLVDAGLIERRMENRRYLHRITDKGREKCETVLAFDQRPNQSKALLFTTWQLVGSVASYLGWREARLADVVLESMIHAAYDKLADKPQDYVRLAKLRPELGGFSKDAVDRVLLAMSRTGLAHLSPDSNRKALTEADHDAAVQIGSEAKHLLVIEAP